MKKQLCIINGVHGAANSLIRCRPGPSVHVCNVQCILAFVSRCLMLLLPLFFFIFIFLRKLLLLLPFFFLLLRQWGERGCFCFLNYLLLCMHLLFTNLKWEIACEVHHAWQIEKLHSSFTSKMGRMWFHKTLYIYIERKRVFSSYSLESGKQDYSGD